MNRETSIFFNPDIDFKLYQAAWQACKKLSRLSKLAAIKKAIRQRRLTETIELLERSGIHKQLALFVIRILREGQHV